jgi:hypothetical protein
VEYDSKYGSEYHIRRLRTSTRQPQLRNLDRAQYGSRDSCCADDTHSVRQQTPNGASVVKQLLQQDGQSALTILGL